MTPGERVIIVSMPPPPEGMKWRPKRGFSTNAALYWAARAHGEKFRTLADKLFDDAVDCLKAVPRD